MRHVCTAQFVILVYVSDVILPQNSSTVAWTMYWGGCRTSRAAECHSELSGSLIFADDAVIFSETTEVPAGALDSLRDEADPL